MDWDAPYDSSSMVLYKRVDNETPLDIFCVLSILAIRYREFFRDAGDYDGIMRKLPKSQQYDFVETISKHILRKYGGLPRGGRFDIYEFELTESDALEQNGTEEHSKDIVEIPNIGIRAWDVPLIRNILSKYQVFRPDAARNIIYIHPDNMEELKHHVETMRTILDNYAPEDYSVIELLQSWTIANERHVIKGFYNTFSRNEMFFSIPYLLQKLLYKRVEFPNLLQQIFDHRIERCIKPKMDMKEQSTEAQMDIEEDYNKKWSISSIESVPLMHGDNDETVTKRRVLETRLPEHVIMNDALLKKLACENWNKKPPRAIHEAYERRFGSAEPLLVMQDGIHLYDSVSEFDDNFVKPQAKAINWWSRILKSKKMRMTTEENAHAREIAFDANDLQTARAFKQQMTECSDLAHEGGPIYAEPTASMVFKIAAALKQLGVKEGELLIELGSGCGTVSGMLAQLLKVKVLGIEISRQRLSSMAKKMTQLLKTFGADAGFASFLAVHGDILQLETLTGVSVVYSNDEAFPPVLMEAVRRLFCTSKTARILLTSKEGKFAEYKSFFEEEGLFKLTKPITGNKVGGRETCTFNVYGKNWSPISQMPPAEHEVPTNQSFMQSLLEKLEKYCAADLDEKIEICETLADETLISKLRNRNRQSTPSIECEQAQGNARSILLLGCTPQRKKWARLLDTELLSESDMVNAARSYLQGKSPIGENNFRTQAARDTFKATLIAEKGVSVWTLSKQPAKDKDDTHFCLDWNRNKWVDEHKALRNQFDIVEVDKTWMPNSYLDQQMTVNFFVQLIRLATEDVLNVGGFVIIPNYPWVLEKLLSIKTKWEKIFELGPISKEEMTEESPIEASEQELKRIFPDESDWVAITGKGSDQCQNLGFDKSCLRQNDFIHLKHEAELTEKMMGHPLLKLTRLPPG